MSRATILDWTTAEVQLKLDLHRAVQYQVYRDAKKHFLAVRSEDEEPIHTLELPEGMKLDRSSYEVLLRYVLLDVVAA
jgi:hypothetical protein